MRSPSRTPLLALALSALLVAAMGAPPIAQNPTVEKADPVGEAEAIACGGVCLAAAGGVIVGAGLGVAATNYLTGDPTSETYTKADKQETQESVEQHADTIQRDYTQFETVVENDVQDGSRTVAWAKLKNETMHNGMNNVSRSQARQEATAEVQDHYSVVVYNYAEQWSHSAQKIEYLRSVWLGHGELNQSPFVGPNGDDTTTQMEGNINGTATGTLRLPNGTHKNVTLLTVDENATAGYDMVSVGPFPESEMVSAPGTYVSLQRSSGSSAWHGENAVVLRSTNQTDRAEIINHTADKPVSDAYNASEQMVSNGELYVNNTYDAVNAGEMDWADTVGPLTISQEMATSYNDTGYHAYAGADLAIMGIDTNLNRTFTITTENGTTLSGSLYTNWKPSKTNGSFVVNTTYSPPSDQTVFFATNDGLQTVNQNFTIDQMTSAKTGETVNSTSTQDYNRQTANATLTTEQLEQLKLIRQEINDLEQSAAGGGGSGWPNLGGMQAGALVALAAVVLILGGRR